MQPVRPWLSFAMRSVASEPNQRLVDSRQSSGSCHFPTYVLKQGAFAPPALPSFITTTPPSVIREADSISHEIVVARLPVPAPSRTSLVARKIDTLRAATTTPVESSDAYHALFSDDIGLPRYYGESASTTAFRGLLSVHSHCGPQSPLTSFEAVSKSASAHLLPPGPLLVLPAGARVGRVGLGSAEASPSPTDQTCLCKAHTTTRPRTPCGRSQLAAIMRTAVLCELVVDRLAHDELWQGLRRCERGMDFS